MCKKVHYLISFVLVLILTGNAPAATYLWDNGGEGALWNVPENWDPDGVPTAADTAQINLPELPDANCVIDSSVAAECETVYVNSNSYLTMTGGTLTTGGHIRIGEPSDSNAVFVMSGGTASSLNGRLWVGMNGSGTLIMTGGELNIYEKIEIGKNASGNGVVYMYGGTMNFEGNSTDLEIATYGTGTLYMYGGVINVQDNIKLAQGNASRTTGVARLYLYGGTINAGNLRDPEQIYGDPLMDITEGVLTLPGDYTATVNDYIKRGWIVAYGGVGIVDATYTTDPSQTTVTGRMLDPELAWNPTPANLDTVERTTDGPALVWVPGVCAASHDVYFGTDPNAVSDANNIKNADDIAVWPEFKGNQDPCSYYPESLELGKTYYWRIDEVNDIDPNSPWKGVVWEFTVADYIVVDNFESYNDIPVEEQGSNLVYYTWIDGYENPSVNGATIGYVIGSSLETQKAHGGGQSVPLVYNNSTAYYSEATVNLDDLAIDKDWTVDNFQVLSLWFYGGPYNSSTEQMYVKLNGVKVTYDGEPSNLQQATWQEWNIDLAAFDIDLSNVMTLSIGFERTGTTGSTGTILIDDIRLYIPGMRSKYCKGKLCERLPHRFYNRNQYSVLIGFQDKETDEDK